MITYIPKAPHIIFRVPLRFQRLKDLTTDTLHVLVRASEAKILTLGRRQSKR